MPISIRRACRTPPPIEGVEIGRSVAVQRDPAPRRPSSSGTDGRPSPRDRVRRDVGVGQDFHRAIPRGSRLRQQVSVLSIAAHAKAKPLDPAGSRARGSIPGRGHFAGMNRAGHPASFLGDPVDLRRTAPAGSSLFVRPPMPNPVHRAHGMGRPLAYHRQRVGRPLKMALRQEKRIFRPFDAGSLARAVLRALGRSRSEHLRIAFIPRHAAWSGVTSDLDIDRAPPRRSDRRYS